MKIRTREISYETASALPRPAHRRPRRPSLFFRTLLRVATIPDLLSVRFRFTEERMEAAGDGPYLILMNHSCFLDLEMAVRIFYPKPMCIVCTSDGFVGKEWLMRNLGCIPTQKFVSDITLLHDMVDVLKKQNTSVLMYPEASYSFDGCETPLPRLGRLLKRLDVPVVTVLTEGAFLRDPLYNGLQKRKMQVSARVRCLLSREEIAEKSAEELDQLLTDTFTYDAFAWQYENRIPVREKFRADGLHRILYKCAHCGAEGRMHGSGITLTCDECGKSYELTEYGRMQAMDGETEFPHIPDWYAWQRGEVRREILHGSYRLDIPVRIGMMVDYRSIYMVGEGRLIHTPEGFTLCGCDGKLHYTQRPQASYGLYSDYFWYEIGDVICIGNRDALYYCFPMTESPVARARLAAEELYRIVKEKRTAQGGVV